MYFYKNLCENINTSLPVIKSENPLLFNDTINGKVLFRIKPLMVDCELNFYLSSYDPLSDRWNAATIQTTFNKSIPEYVIKMASFTGVTTSTANVSL